MGELTGLDDIGIPIAFAVRPAAKTLVVSSGMGITSLLARVSAAMESVEIWHAEQTFDDTITAKAADLPLRYDLDTLQTEKHALHTAHTPLQWRLGRSLISGREEYVPDTLVGLDSTVAPGWQPPTFLSSSNGLASGNTVAEATLHGLLEVVERDCVQAFLMGGTEPKFLSLKYCGKATAELVSRLTEHGCRMRIADITNRIGVPVYRAEIRSAALPLICSGFGAHLDPEVAICRALLEAAQNRVGLISGARDDVPTILYEYVIDTSRDISASASWDSAGQEMTPDALADISSDSIEEDTRRVAEMVCKATGWEPIAVDLTRPDVGIPVVKSIAPGMRFRPFAVTKARE